MMDNDPYVNGTVQNGSVRYNPTPNVAGGAPWFDWGPYLCAKPDQTSPGNQLAWCNGELGDPCNGERDFRYGDLTYPSVCYGDYTHPTYHGQAKVASQLVRWIQGGLPSAQSFISDWVTPWVGQ